MVGQWNPNWAANAVMFGKVLLIAALAAAAAGARAPHADDALQFRKTPLGSRISDNIYEDATLDVPDLISKYGYPVETHTVTTSDGYILTAHRIPRGRDRNSAAGARPAVFLMHGLLSSSADYVVLGPGNALAYLLAEEGYDVWIGNARGNYYSRKHETLNPDSSRDFWQFSWEEIGLYDLPAFVDYVLASTGQTRLHYVGHSQGGTTFLVLNSLRAEYNAKFKSFQGFAPASFFDNNEHETFNSLARYERLLETLASALGIGEIMSKEQGAALVASNYCDGASVFEPACVQAVQANSVAIANFNATMIPIFLSHAPAGAALRQVAHYGQCIRRKAFARYDHGALANLRRYGRLAPPAFDVAAVSAPTVLYYGRADAEVDYRDLLALSARMGNVVDTVEMARPEFNHYDFIWGNNVKEELFDTVIANLKKLD